MNKRGQGLSTNAIVLIILGVVILVLLIAGFTIGFSKLNPFLGSNNVGTIVTSCSTACSTGSVYEFCSLQRTLKADDLGDLASGKNEVVGTCFDFSDVDSLKHKTGYERYGIEKCSALSFDCSNVQVQNP